MDVSHRGLHADVVKQTLLPQSQTLQIVSRYIVEDVVQRVLFVQDLDQRKKRGNEDLFHSWRVG